MPKPRRNQPGRDAEKVRAARLSLIRTMGGRCMRPGCTCGPEGGAASDQRVLLFFFCDGGGEAFRKAVFGGTDRTNRSFKRQRTYYEKLAEKFAADNNSLALMCSNCHIVTQFEERAAEYRAHSQRTESDGNEETGTADT